MAPCIHCGRKEATWCHLLCSDCASLTNAEIKQFKLTGKHPRLPTEPHKYELEHLMDEVRAEAGYEDMLAHPESVVDAQDLF